MAMKTANRNGILITEAKSTKRGLTAIVLTVLWRTGKKNGTVRDRIACRLKEEKRSRLKQNTLLIEGFKPGPSLCLFVKEA